MPHQSTRMQQSSRNDICIVWGFSITVVSRVFLFLNKYIRVYSIMKDHAWEAKLCGYIYMTSCVTVYNQNTQDPLYIFISAVHPHRLLSFFIYSNGWKGDCCCTTNQQLSCTDTDQRMDPQINNDLKNNSSFSVLLIMNSAQKTGQVSPPPHLALLFSDQTAHEVSVQGGFCPVSR